MHLIIYDWQMKIGRLAEGSFVRNVVILMFGSGLSQLIPLLFSPVLSRLFTTSEFGVFTVFSTVAAFLGVLATFRYDLAIMLPKKKSDAFHLLALSVFIALIISLIILIITLLFARPIGRLLNTEELTPWLPFLALSILLLGISQSLNFWHNRNKSYKALSANMISQSTTTAVVSTANGFAKMDAGGLIVGSLTGQLVSSVLYIFRFLKNDKFRLKYISPRRIKYLAKKYIDYPKFSLPHRMVDMISITGIPLLLMMIFTESVVGLYGFMLRVLKAPIGVLAASLGQVFFQQLSEKVSKNQSVKNLFLKTIKNIAFITLPFFVLILLWGPDIFALIFSEQWREAGVYAQYLTPWLFLSSISSPVSQLPLTLGYVKANMIAGILNNSLLILTFLIASIFTETPQEIFLWVGIVMPIFYLCLIFWFYSLVKKYEKSRVLT